MAIRSFGRLTRTLKDAVASVCRSNCAAPLCTESAETLEQIRARIFGHHEGSDMRTGRKILKRAWRVEEVAQYYPLPILDPLQRNIDFER